MKHFVLFKRQEGQLAHAYSVVSTETLEKLPKDIIKATKEIGELEIVPKELCKQLVEELGGVWYGNN